MSTIRKIDSTPTFSLLSNEKETQTLFHEIIKIKPKTEISIEGLNELATATVSEWQAKRNFFVVKFKQKPKTFDARTESESGLRVFFKLQLFSTQLVFKSTTLRRLDENTFHYRIPEQIYKQQRRGALRVPVSSSAARLLTPKGEFPLINLSVAGARLAHGAKKLSANNVNANLENCTLVIGRSKISNPEFGVRITHHDDTGMGVLFHGLTAADKIRIKQFLVEALRAYFETPSHRSET